MSELAVPSQSNAGVIAAVVVGVLLIMVFVGYGYITTSSSLSSLSRDNANLGQQLTGLNQQNSNLGQQLSSQNQQISNLNQQVSNGNQQVSSVSQRLSTLEQRTQAVVTVSNTIVSVQTTSVVTTSTVTSVSAVPQSTLVVTSNTYDSTSHIFTFQVQNNQNYIVYAQLSASLWGQTSFGCNGQRGTFISQVYAFNPGQTTTTQLNLNLGSYSGFCGGSPLNSIQLNFVIPQSTPVSPSYTFVIVPNYAYP